MRRLKKSFEMEEYSVYKDNEEDNFYTIENINTNAYKLKENDDILEDLPLDAFMEYVNENTCSYYNQK